MSDNSISNTRPSVTYTFDDFADMFVETGALGTPSELHGLLCGQLAIGLRFDADAWLTVATNHMNVPNIDDDEDKTELVTWYMQTLAQLEALDFSFALLLPDEEDELSGRVESLGQWCAGFLSGFGLGYDHKKHRLTDDIADAMEHLAQISQVSVDDWSNDEDMDNDDEEQNYTEVMEYVRVVVMMVFGEYNPLAAAKSDQHQVH